MHYSVIILSNKTTSYNNSYIINSKVKLIDDCHLELCNDLLSFDYLIITDISLIEGLKEAGVLTESKIPVTNFEKQTSIENIYYCTDNDINEVLINL